MSGVVWDEFCDLWEEWSCIGWVVWVVWDNLGEVERERSNSGGEGGEGKEYKPKNKSPRQRCEEKKLNLRSCVMMFKKKARRRIMLQRYNDKNTQQKRAQTTNHLTCTNDPLLTCTDEPRTTFPNKPMCNDRISSLFMGKSSIDAVLSSVFHRQLSKFSLVSENLAPPFSDTSTGQFPVTSNLEETGKSSS